MKMQLKTKLWGALALGAMLGLSTGSALRAQDEANGAKQGQGARRGGGLRRVITQLDLTAEQNAKLQPIVKEHNAASKAIRENAALSQQEKRAKNRELMQA
ncbi:MAG: hypothetical protein JWN98_592, partial [Abditibacteriota bacterium]|nr:hypothetical protein [Abditibacteriota bacterium]